MKFQTLFLAAALMFSGSFAIAASQATDKAACCGQAAQAGQHEHGTGAMECCKDHKSTPPDGQACCTDGKMGDCCKDMQKDGAACCADHKDAKAGCCGADAKGEKAEKAGCCGK